MKPVLAQMGAGAISPKIASHLQKAAKPAVKQINAPKTQMGAGIISPKIKLHLSK